MNLEDEFAQFWVAYPRKRKRLDALKAFTSARRAGVTLDTMLAALAWQRGQSQWVRDDGQYIPYPASWIRAGSYDDEPDERLIPPITRWECQHAVKCNSKSWCELLIDKAAEGWDRDPETGKWSQRQSRRESA